MPGRYLSIVNLFFLCFFFAAKTFVKKQQKSSVSVWKRFTLFFFLEVFFLWLRHVFFESFHPFFLFLLKIAPIWNNFKSFCSFRLLRNTVVPKLGIVFFSDFIWFFVQTSLQKQKEVAKTSNQAPMQQLFSRPNFWFFFFLSPLSNVVETFFFNKEKNFSFARH